jgi:hypothetical protein
MVQGEDGSQEKQEKTTVSGKKNAGEIQKYWALDL